MGTVMRDWNDKLHVDEGPTRNKDVGMLRDLLAHEELRDHEREAFADMAAWLVDHRGASLRAKQREWVERVHARLIPRYENLVSGGAVPNKPSSKVYDFEKQARPLKPPGRK